jgi:CubicO group peptidase (beta-lactamase class C family)
MVTSLTALRIPHYESSLRIPHYESEWGADSVPDADTNVSTATIVYYGCGVATVQRLAKYWGYGRWEQPKFITEELRLGFRSLRTGPGVTKEELLSESSFQGFLSLRRCDTLRRMRGTLLCAALVLFTASAAAGAPLDRATRYVDDAVKQGQYAGAVTLVARHWHVLQSRAFGYRDVARSDPMRVDAIFQIYSMTKPIASVAALQLLEQGRLTLDDPVSRFLPEFARMQVLEGEREDSARLRPAARPITIRDLFTHTAGFAAGEKLHGAAVDRLNNARLDETPSLAAYATGLAALPLANDPGTRFSYDGVNTEVLSRIVEVISSVPFDEFISRRVLVPLRMVDTGFSVPPERRARIVEMTSTDETGRLVAASGGPAVPGEMLKRYPSGAGGLYSTAGDYLRFCQMLLNRGELDGVRILERKTVELMMSNHLTQLSPPVNEFNDGEGFGLGGYVVLDPARRGRPGSTGQFGWSGAAATWFTIDPHEELIVILMMQHLPRRLPHDPPRLGRPFMNLVYRSLVN